MATFETKDKKNIPICVFTNKQYIDIKKDLNIPKSVKTTQLKNHVVLHT